MSASPLFSMDSSRALHAVAGHSGSSRSRDLLARVCLGLAPGWSRDGGTDLAILRRDTPHRRSGRPDRGEVNFRENITIKTAYAAVRRLLKHSSRLVLWVTQTPSALHPGHRLILRAADVVLVDTPAIADAICRLGVPASRIVALSDPPDLALFAAASRNREPPDHCRLIFVGDLVPRSGVADLLHCLASWACRHPARLVEIWWAGEGCLRGVLEAQPIPANLSQRFLGPLSREEIASAFTQCSALALPALFSEWSHFVSEALVAGLPVLGSNRCRAVAEFLTHGETGWVFDPHSPGEIGQAVDLALTASPEDLRRMGIAAAKRLEPLSSSRLEERIGRVLGLNPPDGMFEAAGSGF